MHSPNRNLSLPVFTTGASTGQKLRCRGTDAGDCRRLAIHNLGTPLHQFRMLCVVRELSYLLFTPCSSTRRCQAYTAPVLVLVICRGSDLATEELGKRTRPTYHFSNLVPSLHGQVGNGARG